MNDFVFFLNAYPDKGMQIYYTLKDVYNRLGQSSCVKELDDHEAAEVWLRYQPLIRQLLKQAGVEVGYLPIHEGQQLLKDLLYLAETA